MDLTKRNVLFTLLIIILATAFTLRGKGGDVVSQIDGNMLGVGSAQGSQFIELSDITSVKLVENLPIGELLSGSDSGKVITGVFENDIYGVYHLYAYTKTGTYIVVKYKDGILVFNADNQKDTERIYNKLNVF